jgi:hypothetical protein
MWRIPVVADDGTPYIGAAGVVAGADAENPGAHAFPVASPDQSFVQPANGATPRHAQRHDVLLRLEVAQGLQVLTARLRTSNGGECA